MQYTIKGGTLPYVTCTLQAGEAVYTESGGMSWMTTNLEMSTNMEGGLLGGLKRSLAGESMFMTTYTCTGGEGSITFASSFPGTILPISLQQGQSIICQRSAFLAAERSVQLEMFLQRKLGVGFFGGEGFILQKISGPGLVFLEVDGSAEEVQLQAGQSLRVDTGCVALFTPSVSINIEMVKGFKNIFFGGEGLFLTTLTGPGRVWLQSMPFANLANRIIARVPKN